MKFKIMSCNVNGIMACARHGFLDRLNEEKPHVICLQETKANVDQLYQELLEPKGYHYRIHRHGGKRGTV